MLYKKFTRDIYEGPAAPHFKTYKTENNKEALVITDDYKILKQGKRFDMKSIVGDGATSVVVKACNPKEPSKIMAIKMVKRVFDHTAFAHRAMRELRILRCLGPHDNVIQI